MRVNKRALSKLSQLWHDSDWPKVIVIGLVAAGLCCLNIIAFYPGSMSKDSIVQLGQALGKIELSTWHPVFMALLWRFLIFITGHISAFMVLQIIVLWAALFLIAIYVYKETKRIPFSFMALGIGLMPNVINISGVVWKDILMAFCFLLAIATTLLASLFESSHHGAIKRRPTAIILYVVSIVLIVFAVLFRVNAIAAAVPLFFLVVNKMLGGQFKKKWLSITLVAVLAAMPMVIDGILVNLFKATQHSSTATMYRLDIANLATASEIELSDKISDDKLRGQLSQIADSQCSHNNSNLDTHVAVFLCYDYDGDHADENTLRQLKDLWTKLVVQHPVQYLFYKVDTYSLFLLSNDGVWHQGWGPNEYITDRPPISLSLRNAVKRYVSFADEHFSLLFLAIFWLIIAIAIIIYSIRRKLMHRYISLALSMSAVLYILSYAIGNLTPDYRFIYWSVIATLLAVYLIVLDNYRDKRYQDSKSA